MSVEAGTAWAWTWKMRKWDDNEFFYTKNNSSSSTVQWWWICLDEKLVNDKERWMWGTSLKILQVCLIIWDNNNNNLCVCLKKWSKKGWWFTFSEWWFFKRFHLGGIEEQCLCVCMYRSWRQESFSKCWKRLSLTQSCQKKIQHAIIKFKTQLGIKTIDMTGCRIGFATRCWRDGSEN